ALRREHVTALAVLVQEKRDMRAAVRIVLETLDPGRNGILVAAPVDGAQVVLVAATLMAHGDAPVVVAPAAAPLRLGERRERPALVELRVDDLDERPAAGGRGFYLDQWHGLFRRGEIDFLAFGKPHVGLLPASLAPGDAPEVALLAAHVEHRHVVDLGLEHELDR